MRKALLTLLLTLWAVAATAQNPISIAQVGVTPVTTTVPVSGTVTVTDGAGALNVIVDSGTTVVTQGTAANLNATVVGTGTFTVQAQESGNWLVQGMVGSGVANSGNPLKVGGVFNTVQPTVTNGQVVDFQATARGALIAATGADTFNVTVNTALPAGTAVIGHVIADAGSTTAVTGTVTTNVTQFGSTNISTGTGASGTGIPRVTVSNDSSLAANQSVDVSRFGGSAVATGVGAAGSGVPRVTASRDDITGSVALTVASVAGAACPAATTSTVTTSTSCIVAPVTGYAGVAGVFFAGTSTGTMVYQASYDGGTTWSSALFETSTNTQGVTTVFTNPNAETPFHFLLGSNVSHVRIFMNSCSAGCGSTTVLLRTSSIASVFALASLTMSQIGNAPSLFISSIGGTDGSIARAAVLKNTNPAATDYGLVVRPVDGLTAAITLQGSQVSGVANATTTRTTTTGLDRCRYMSILLNITGGGVATGTLQIFLQDSVDGGTTWDDLWASNTFTFGAATITQRAWLNSTIIQSTITSATPGVQAVLGSSTAVSVEALTTGMTRQGPFGDRIRVREKVSGVSGTPTGVTYAISATCK